MKCATTGQPLVVPDTAISGMNIIRWDPACEPSLRCSTQVVIPELVSNARAEATASQVLLSWDIADSSADTPIVSRSDAEQPLEELGEGHAPAGSTLRYEDRTIEPGRRYRYWLALPLAKRRIDRGFVDVSVPDLLSGATATAREAAIRLEWRVADDAARHAMIERRMADGQWAVLAPITADGAGRLVFEDLAVEPGVVYHYRLAVTVNGREHHRGEIMATAAIPLRSVEIRRATANPTRGPLLVVATVGGHGPIGSKS